MRIFDSHTHVHFPAYDNDRDSVIKRAREQKIKMVCAGTQISTSESAIKLSEQYPNDIWATVGFHPSHVAHAQHARTSQTERGLTQTARWHHDPEEQKETMPEKFEIEKLRNLAKHPKVVAIGECGLDYFRLTTDNQQLATIKNLQRDVFVQQVELAKKLGKALMIHCRPSKGTNDAYEDLLDILHGTLNFSLNKIVHFYVGSLEVAKKLMDAGFYFTFGGVITFTRDYDEVIKYIPPKQILLETDAPYVAPAPYRGKRNEPAYIIETAKKISEIKNIGYDEVCETTFLNTLTVLNVDA